ncbi:site-specific integrase [Photobacterium sp. GB-72]|uniref:tyrosine-type recombinase/integrase n=1 Tax=Photobacterium sp. GB-72 TaxID=2022105 RepID=UPI000D15C203|nr:site-specific integrase [Photobacterium sp. GB-72]PSV27621.1 hypothetical protein C9J40_20005 [Photobacterium sp. GB-72]
MTTAYFDTIQFIEQPNQELNLKLMQKSFVDISYEYELVTDFLCQFTDNSFKSYRSSCNTFFVWLYDYYQKALLDVTKRDIAKFVKWLRNPPAELIARSPQPTHKGSLRSLNVNWRPFVNNDSTKDYRIKDASLRTNLLNISALFRFLIDEDVIDKNPVSQYLRNNRTLTKSGESESLRYLTTKQWHYCYKAALRSAENEPDIHERTLFLITSMYAGYLRISEVSDRPGYSCCWNQFQEMSGYWVLNVPRSKFGKSRQIEVCEDWLKAIIRYRKYLGLSPLPTNDDKPIFIRHKIASRGDKKGQIDVNLSASRIFEIVKQVFEFAAQLAEENNDLSDASVLRIATPHWLRHSGISHDVERGRPLSHIQQNAGHADLTATSRYVHSTSSERYQSLVNKKI